MMDTLLSASVLLPLAALLWVIGWLIIVVNGKRPVHFSFEGLGLDIKITPCPDGCAKLREQPSKE